MSELGGLYDKKLWFNYVIVGLVTALMLIWYFFFYQPSASVSLPANRPSFRELEDQASRYLSDKSRAPSADQVTTAENEAIKYLKIKSNQPQSAEAVTTEESAGKYLNSSQ